MKSYKCTLAVSRGTALKNSRPRADSSARVRGASFSLGGLVPYRWNDLSRSSPRIRETNTGMQERRAKILRRARAQLARRAVRRALLPRCRATN